MDELQRTLDHNDADARVGRFEQLRIQRMRNNATQEAVELESEDDVDVGTLPAGAMPAERFAPLIDTTAKKLVASERELEVREKNAQGTHAACKAREPEATSAKDLMELEAETKFSGRQVERASNELKIAREKLEAHCSAVLQKEAAPLSAIVADLNVSHHVARAKILSGLIALAPFFEIAGLALNTSGPFEFLESVRVSIQLGSALISRDGSKAYDPPAVASICENGREEKARVEKELLTLNPKLSFLNRPETVQQFVEFCRANLA